jgi:predicted transcriptional regulator of viral defense system
MTCAAPAPSYAVLGDSNMLALASRIANPYYIGFSTASAHYGLTTQHRNVIFLVTPVRLRPREVGESQVRIVNPAVRKFFSDLSRSMCSDTRS